MIILVGVIQLLDLKLSIIIPVYNVEKHISRCLDSLVNQDIDKSEYEVIIVSDGSKDNSVSIAERYCELHTNFFIYQQENQGVGAARNKGLSLAIGEYIYFLDPDDYIADHVLKTIMDTALKFNPEVLTFNSQGTTSLTLNKSRFNDLESVKINAISGLEYIANHSFKNEIWWYITSKKFIDKINLKFIEGRWMEDAIFTAQLFVEAKSMINLSFDIHRHVKIKGSAMTSKEPSHYLKIINDNSNAAVVYNTIIKKLEQDKHCNRRSIVRLKSRQQSFVFFMMIRILKSTFKKEDIIPLLDKMKSVNAYKLDEFVGEDYKGFTYYLLSKLFSSKHLFYLIFVITNPILKQKN
ncbi:glycosyltransferase [Hwangdonia lutea]|uniref:Glycosyltransferase n=1 Tax=Hwangdonia lutea TaxID=3075823 RepID=A0AA97HRG2_9FLAO|nr:glycosyltransferase [Hwangdonia sp. SCSIO 19198]WOD43428.1 glycosyltransferase [Hwangdonia sp. SCSIO 19198]